MKTIKFLVKGTCPLMMNNPQTVNPMNSFAKELKKITSKRTKTDDDLQELFHLQFVSSCYWEADTGKWIVPASMIMSSITAGAKENRLGAKFERSLFVHGDAEMIFPCNGCTPEELWTNHNEEYVDIRAVGIMKSKVPTARFICKDWSFETEVSFDETQLNDGEVWNAIEAAGKRYGIGTYRKCYGRFEAIEIKDSKGKKKK